MKILYISNMYPSKYDTYYGIFIKEQIDYYVAKYKVESQLYIIEGRKSKFNYIKCVFHISKLIMKGKFDLIHIHFGLSGLFLLINPFINVPSIITLHGSDILTYKRNRLIPFMTRIILSRVNRIIILNDAMAARLHYYQDKIVKIPCGIDLGAFSPKRNNTVNNCFIIGFPSDRRRPEKNFTLFREIVEALEESGILIEIVEFCGLTRPQVAQELSRLDCLLMTSISEGSPQIIKEALACNLPIVSTKVGDLEILLRGVQNCYLIDSYRSELFVPILKSIYSLRPEERSSNGRKRIVELELDQTSVASKINCQYFNLLNINNSASDLMSL